MRRILGSYEFLGPIVLIGVPYALAAVVQDGLVPWIAERGGLELAALAACGLATALAAVWMRARRALAREVDRAASLAFALAGAEQELRTITRALDRDLHGPVRRLATVATWLGRDARGLLDAPARRHLDVLTARAARVRDVVESLIGARPLAPSLARPIRARPATPRRACRTSPLPSVVLRRA